MYSTYKIYRRKLFVTTKYVLNMIPKKSMIKKKLDKLYYIEIKK